MRKNDTKLRKEHEAIRESVGFYDFTHETVEVSGRDAGSLLDKIFVNDISGADVGQGKYTSMLNERGYMLDDIIIFRIETNMYWLVTLYSEQMLAWLNTHADGFDVEFKNLKDVTVMYAIQGPESLNVLNNILAKNINDLKFNRIIDNKINDVPVKVARCGFTGELGYELHFEAEHIDFVEAKLYEGGKPYNIIELKTDVTLTSLPTEKGLKIMRDYEKLNPIEAGLGWTIDWNKDFIGKEAVLETKEKGPRVSLVGFTVSDDNAEINFNDEIKKNGELVGKVTNYTYGYTVEKSIGFALIDNSVVQLGDKVDIGKDSVEALLTSSKFFDPRDKRRRGEV